MLEGWSYVKANFFVSTILKNGLFSIAPLCNFSKASLFFNLLYKNKNNLPISKEFRSRLLFLVSLLISEIVLRFAFYRSFSIL